MMNYYSLAEVSNSDLSALKKKIFGLGESERDLTKAYAFGSLVDAMLTEPKRCNYVASTLLDENYNLVVYDFETWDHAKRLVDVCMRDALVSKLVKNMIGQYVFRRTLNFNYDVDQYHIKARCKFDGYNKMFSVGVDYKTTSCTTRKQFIDTIEHFDYDRQAAWYMDLARIDFHWIIGISKKTGEVYKYAIQRGYDAHRSGVEKYQYLAYKWVTLIDGFKYENKTEEGAGDNQQHTNGNQEFFEL